MRHDVYRNYMYADDLVLWLMAILEMSGRDCPIFNVGCDQALEIGVVAENISSIFGVSVHYLYIRSTKQDRCILSVEKALGKVLKLNYSHGEAIEETINRIREVKSE